MNKENPIWYILGAGAIGSLWGVSWVKQHAKPVLLLRDEAHIVQYQQAGGISLHEDDGLHFYPLDAGYAGQEIEVSKLLITTKSWQTLDAIRPLGPFLKPDAKILLLQNGMGVADQIVKEFPQQQLYCGITTDGVYRSGRFSITRAGTGKTVIGPYHNCPSDGLQELLTELPGQQLDIETTINILPSLWEKLLINSIINPLTALYDCPNGELIKLKHRQRITRLTEEAAQIATAAGYPTSSQALTEKVLQIADSTATNISSMLADFRAGRSSELNDITGYLCQQANVHDINCPSHQQLLIQLAKPPHAVL
ncbi:MAG: 2-dehydropantoate 2-reductase [Pseudomonadales bacterium]